MRLNRHLLQLCTIAVVSILALAPSADAKSKPLHLVGLKKCNQVMVGADFIAGLEELTMTTHTSAAGLNAETSVCNFGSNAPGAFGEHQIFTEPNPAAKPTPQELVEHPITSVGSACFANLFKLMEATPAATGLPPTGCYSLATVVLIVAQGPKVEALIRHYKSHHLTLKAKTWPPGFTRAVLHGFPAGSVAEVGYSGAPGAAQRTYGYLDVANAQITIEEKTWPPSTPRSLITLLHDAQRGL